MQTCKLNHHHCYPNQSCSTHHLHYWSPGRFHHHQGILPKCKGKGRYLQSRYPRATGSADFTPVSFPGIGTHTFTVSSHWGESSAFAAHAIHTVHVSIFRSTRYPLLLGGQRQCGFKPCPRILHMTGAAGNRTPDPSLSGPTPQPTRPYAPHEMIRQEMDRLWQKRDTSKMAFGI